MNRRAAWRLALLLLVCLLVYWVRLGTGGFHSTEGHRVIPAYEMLDSGRWLVPTLFDQPYLRKPPGMPWAVAGMSELLGRTEFAARAVSALAATLMAVIAFWAGGRWFGPRAALPAGLAQALMPWMWESGRAAEIEALNNLGTQVAAFLLIDALLFAPRRAVRVAGALGAGAGIILLALAKGPASAPVLAGVAAAACIVTGSVRPARGVLWLALATGAAGAGLVFWMIARAASGLEPVTQSPGAFLFEPGELLAVATLIPMAFLHALPVSLALLFPWGPDARGETRSPRSFRLARALAGAWLIAVAVFMLAGVRNPRYTLPAAVLLAPLAGDVVAGLGVWLAPKRDRIARILLLGRAWAWPVLLLVGAGIYIGLVEAGRRATSGREPGRELGAMVARWAATHSTPEPVVLLADQLIEARPETLLAAENEALESGIDLRVRWIPGLADDARQTSLDPGTLLALRGDDDVDERGQIEAMIGKRLVPLEGDLTVHKYRFGLYLVP